MASAPQPHTVQIMNHMTAAFPTPIVVYDWPDIEALNYQLRETIERERAAGNGVVKSNLGGWHSSLAFLAQESAPGIKPLLGHIRALVMQLLPEVMDPPASGKPLGIAIEGWANSLGAGDYNSLHNHPNAQWSGVYYVTGNPSSDGTSRRPLAGRLELVDPRPAASILHADTSKLSGRCTVEPQPGRMVLFPGWLQHFVHPHDGPGQRVSIAFNIFLSENS